nr:nitrogenase component 1 [Methanolinea mesophila]
MAGAVACLSGFSGLGVIIHGSSGCYFYPATVLRTDLSSTFLVEEDVVFGAEERVRETVERLLPRFDRLAVVTTCATALTGDDIHRITGRDDILVVDSPGFMGEFEQGFSAALEALPLRSDPEHSGVTLAGISAADPFGRGNELEIRRLCSLAGIRVGAVLCRDRFSSLSRLPPATLSANPDIAGRFGEEIGSMLGFPAIRGSLPGLSLRFPDADTGVLEEELREAEERVVRACDKYLRRYDPPSVAIFAQAGYAGFAADMLSTYLDAGITGIFSRNPPGNGALTQTGKPPGTPPGSPPGSTTGDRGIRQVLDLGVEEEILRADPPDLIAGSSFEQSLMPGTPFVGITPPLRGRVRLRATPLAGTEGALSFMEDAINACIDEKKRV